ncbi:hypothetical protein ES708_02676 [subsurface metagenome]
MSTKILAKKEAVFRSEGRLLQELGERLVASPDVALLELIKNAYDADSPVCRVYFAESRDILVIEDEGHGMTEDEFLGKWMRIATDTKIRDVNSKLYGRKLTGAKGIGRFAVRFMGSTLNLQSVSYDSNAKTVLKLVADFDWDAFDRGEPLEQVKIPYSVSTVEPGQKTGTVLRISRLKTTTDEVFGKNVRTDILRMTSPLAGLENGGFGRSTKSETKDPGFVVFIPGYEDNEQDKRNIAASVLANFWGRITISLKEAVLNYSVYLAGSKEPEFSHSQEYQNDLRTGLFTDIRFFPYRAGLFSGKDVDGRLAWKWVRENSGVAVIDHGFRMKPYGYADDDWLLLDKSEARSERNWKSSVMLDSYQMPEEIRRAEGQNFALNLPKNHQLIGAVFVESNQQGRRDGESIGLIPAADRMGLLVNRAFRQLGDIVRGGGSKCLLGATSLKWRNVSKRKRADSLKKQEPTYRRP